MRSANNYCSIKQKDDAQNDKKKKSEFGPFSEDQEQTKHLSKGGLITLLFKCLKNELISIINYLKNNSLLLEFFGLLLFVCVFL